MPTRGTRVQTMTWGSLCAALVALAFAAGAADAAPVTAPVSLDTVILKASQVGPGYGRATVSGGRIVKGQVTLDFCGGGYASEALRARRFQAVYGKQGSALVLSNEVVRYQPGGARKALAEVAKRVRTCPKTAVASGSATGVKEKYLSISVIDDPKLLGGSVAVQATVEYTYKGKKRRDSIVAIYQRHGDYLSGVYAYGGTAADRLAAALRGGARERGQPPAHGSPDGVATYEAWCRSTSCPSCVAQHLALPGQARCKVGPMGTGATRPSIAEAVGRLGTEGAFAVLARARALEATGRDVIHLEIGEPDFETPPHVAEAGIAAIRAGETHYCQTAGLPVLREAAAGSLAASRGVRDRPGERARRERRQAVPLLHGARDVRPGRRGDLSRIRASRSTSPRCASPVRRPCRCRSARSAASASTRSSSSSASASARVS